MVPAGYSRPVGEAGRPNRRRIAFALALAAVVSTLVAILPLSSQGARPGIAVIEDYSDAVTAADLGFNDFSGSTGTINKDDLGYGRTALIRSTGGGHALRFSWNFGISSDQSAFTGIFHSLFGQIRTEVTVDGTTVRPLTFPEHALNLNAIDHPIKEPGGPRRVRRLRLAVVYKGPQNLKLRAELKDTKGNGRFTRFALKGSSERRVVTWNFRNPAAYRSIGAKMNLRRAKELVLLVERR